MLFQIPLVPQDQDNFDFILWELNMHNPAPDISRDFLSQEMKNRFTTYQLYVFRAFVNIPKVILLIHYMDGLFLAHLDIVYLQKTAEKVLKCLMSLQLMVAPDKVEMVSLFAFLVFFSIAMQVCFLSFK